MAEFETEVIEVIQRTHNVKSFRFKRADGADFAAGQYFFVTIKNDGAKMTKHFSFSSAPGETGYVEFTKKLTGSDYSKALERLKRGDWARLRMPYGSFTYDGRSKKIAFLSGGIGITPIRSICFDMADKGIDAHIVLIYGNRTAKDIAFREDFDRLTEDYGKIKVVHVLESDDIPAGSRKGLITPGLITSEIPDWNERKFYVSGPPAMVGFIDRILTEELSIDGGNIVKENFSGY